MKLAHQFIDGKRQPLSPHQVPQGMNENEVRNTRNPNIIPKSNVRHIQFHVSSKSSDILPQMFPFDDVHVDY